jgi:hypothetical protein
MKSNSEIGLHQELQPNGMIATSWTRNAASWTFVFWVITTIYYCASYEYHFYLLSKMVGTSIGDGKTVINEQTFITLLNQLEVINWTIFGFFGLAMFAPKVLQKFAETRIK